MANTAPSGSYANVNGLNLYYEIHGSGQPLVLLHGAFSAIGSSFGLFIPTLAQNRQVIAVDLQGHGRTADIDRPLTTQAMAEDVAALIRHLNVAPADLFGYSMGSDVALHLAIRHPELVRKLATASASSKLSGLHPGMMDGWDQMQVEQMDGTPWQVEYAQVAPHPENWPTLFQKIMQMNMNINEWPDESIRSIQAPTLLIIADSDIVRPEHAVEMFRLLGGGVAGDVAGMPKSQLAIVPGTSHVTLMFRPELLLPMLTSFFDAPMPAPAGQ